MHTGTLLRTNNVYLFMAKFIGFFAISICYFSGIAQNVVVSLPALNYIYTGFPNPVEIAVAGIPTKKLNVSTKGCSI